MSIPNFFTYNSIMQEKEIKETINNLSKMSNEQLMSELAKYMTAQQQKDGGRSMQKTIERIKPLLNAEQRARLEDILQSVASSK